MQAFFVGSMHPVHVYCLGAEAGSRSTWRRHAVGESESDPDELRLEAVGSSLLDLDIEYG